MIIFLNISKSFALVYIYSNEGARRIDPRQCKCAHQPTRLALGLPKVIDESPPHDSSGSTVDTFLPQEDLAKNYVDIDEMETITEVGSEPED